MLKLDEIKVLIIIIDYILDENIFFIIVDFVIVGELVVKKFIDGGFKYLVVFRGLSFLMIIIECILGFNKVLKKYNLYVDVFDFDLVNLDVKFIE